MASEYGYQPNGSFSPGYGAGMTPQQMANSLAMAQLQAGSSTSPIRSKWQGAARLADALMGGLSLRQAGQGWVDGRQQRLDMFPGAAQPSGAAPAASAGDAGPLGTIGMPPTSGNPTAGTSPVSGANNSTKYSYDPNTGKFDLTDGFNPPPVNAGSGLVAPNNAAGGSAPGGPMPGSSRGGGVPIPGGRNMIASNDPNFMPSFTEPSSGSAPGGGDALAQLKANISRTESGGNYGAIGPDTGNGNRAIGKYQVMASNVPQWTREVLGQAMTPEQFRASPEAQEAVASAKLGGYMQQYGPAGAARMWFTGKPNGTGADVNGMTGDRYAALATAGMGGGGADSRLRWIIPRWSPDQARPRAIRAGRPLRISRWAASTCKPRANSR